MSCFSGAFKKEDQVEIVAAVVVDILHAWRKECVSAIAKAARVSNLQCTIQVSMSRDHASNDDDDDDDDDDDTRTMERRSVRNVCPP